MGLDDFGLEPHYVDLNGRVTVLPQRSPCSSYLDPPSIFQRIVQHGIEKAKLSWWKTLWLGVLAGVYVSFGSALVYFTGGQAPALASADPGLANLLKGLFGLPFGLALVLICGGELVTANFCYMSAAFFECRISALSVLKNWFWSFWGNLAGSLLIVWLVDETHLLSHDAQGQINNQVPVQTAEFKTHLSWGYVVVGGILANWLVCLGVWQSTASQDIISKLFSVLLPVAAFESMQFQHVVANMFLVCFGIKVGADIPVGRYIWHSMIPTLIGNCIGVVFFLSGSYSFCYGSLGDRMGNGFYRMLHQGKLPDTLGPRYDDSAHNGAPRAHEGSKKTGHTTRTINV